MRVVKLSLTTALLAVLAGCATTEPGVRVETIEVVKTIQRPCPGVAPERPAPLGPLPTDAVKLAAVLGAKLAEWSGSGGYGDRADAIMARCLGE